MGEMFSLVTLKKKSPVLVFGLLILHRKLLNLDILVHYNK